MVKQDGPCLEGNSLGVVCAMQGHVHRQLGLSSTEALTALHTQLASTLEQFKRKRRAEDTWQARPGPGGRMSINNAH